MPRTIENIRLADRRILQEALTLSERLDLDDVRALRPELTQLRRSIDGLLESRSTSLGPGKYPIVTRGDVHPLLATGLRESAQDLNMSANEANALDILSTAARNGLGAFSRVQIRAISVAALYLSRLYVPGAALVPIPYNGFSWKRWEERRVTEQPLRRHVLRLVECLPALEIWKDSIRLNSNKAV